MDQQQFDMMMRRLDGQDESLKKILVETGRTNGRVTGLERQVEKFQKDIDSLNESKNLNKGIGKATWGVVGLALSIVALIVAYIKK